MKYANNLKIQKVIIVGEEEVKNKIKSKESNKKIANKLKFTLYITLIILISLISFVGVYQRDKNKLVNKL